MHAIVPLGIALQQTLHELPEIVHAIRETLVDAGYDDSFLGHSLPHLPPRLLQFRRHSGHKCLAVKGPQTPQQFLI